MIFEYIIGYLVVQTICLVWFYSPLKITLGQIFFDKKICSNDEFETHLMMRSMFFAKLLSCYICFSFWISLIVGAVGCLLLSLPVYALFLAQFTYPAVCYLYKSIVDMGSAK